MKTLLIIVALVLTACTPNVVIREVKVPVIIPCIESYPVKPSLPLEDSTFDGDLFNLVKKALAELELRKGYEGELEAAITACKK